MTLAAAAVPFTHFELPPDIIVLGIVTGLTYGLLGVGLTLIYKTTRVINFAHGELGALPAIIVPVLVLNHGISYWVAMPLALAAGAVGGAVMDLCVIRRLADAPRLVVMVATIGVSQILLVVELVIPKVGRYTSSPYPVPFHASIVIGQLRLTSGNLLILGAAPVLVAGLALFLRRTNVGIASRAAAENREAAELAGIPVRRVSLVVWTIAGLFAAASAVLAGPTHPTLSTQALGPSIMVKALAAAMLGGLSSLPQVFLGGIAIGVLELLVLWNYPTGGAFELVLLVVVIVSLMLRPGLGRLARGGDESSWSLAGSVTALPARVAALRPVIWLRRGSAFAALVAVGVVPLLLTNARLVLLSSVILFAVMALSLVVLTGLTGQVSLGQFAFVGLGALVGGRLSTLGYPPWVAILYAMAAGGIAAAVMGIPALRIRGLFLAVTSLGFAVMSSAWLFQQPWLVHRGADSSLQIPRPTWLGISFERERNYCWLSFVVLIAAIGVVRRYRSTGLGRAAMAVRDNETAAAALAVSPRRAKLTAFVLAGVLAALGGYFYGGLLVTFANPDTFSPGGSIDLLSTTIFGGITTVTGAVLGAVWVQGIPYFLGGNWGLLSTGVGLLLVLLVYPGGLAGVIFGVRDRVVRRLTGANLRPEPVDATGTAARPMLLPRERAPADAEHAVDGELPLVAERVTVRFGGNTAVDDVSINVRRGEVVGLLGPNGAGKTTLFDVLSGVTAPDAGAIRLHGADITWLPSYRRATLGLGRTFQQARLFADLSVTEAVSVALEGSERAEILPSLLGLPPSRRAERGKRQRALEVIDLLGLGDYADRRIAELSTGTRRVTELACVIGLGADVVLLDEPMAGLAQREVEAFAPLLGQIRAYLNASMIVIEHDVPLMAAISDRIYVLAAGRVIAEGSPDDVREDPVVRAAYFGGDDNVVQRSGELAMEGAR
ncbi:MAG: ABC transporter permease subunit [Actinomycetes bacterium]